MKPEDLEKTLLFVKQKSGKRQRISNSETKQFQEFLRLKYPTPSGYKDEKYVQTVPIYQLCQEFLEWRKLRIEEE